MIQTLMDPLCLMQGLPGLAGDPGPRGQRVCLLCQTRDHGDVIVPTTCFTVLTLAGSTRGARQTRHTRVDWTQRRRWSCRSSWTSRRTRSNGSAGCTRLHRTTRTTGKNQDHRYDSASPHSFPDSTGMFNLPSVLLFFRVIQERTVPQAIRANEGNP